MRAKQKILLTASQERVEIVRLAHKTPSLHNAPGSVEPGAYFIDSQLRPAKVSRWRRWASASPLWG